MTTTGSSAAADRPGGASRLRHARSITLRLTLLFGIASTAVLLALGYVIGVAVEAHFADQDRADLGAKLELAERILARVRGPGDLDLVPEQLDDALTGHHGLSIAIVRADESILFATSDAQFPGNVLGAPAVGRPSALASWTHRGHAYRGLAEIVPIGAADGERATVTVALNIDHHREFMAQFRRSLWIAVAFGAGLTALLGWFVARRGMLPVHAMTTVLQRISGERLEERLPVDRLPRELVGLGEAFNGMLDRLQSSFDRLSEFSADIAHELRTPVGTLTMHTQVALSRARSAEEYREVLYANLEELERLGRMIGDMLFLAKADHGLLVPRTEAVDLAAETCGVFEFYEALAEERRVGLAQSGEGRIAGDALMIRRALSNLVGNALRHTRAGEVVRVTIDRPVEGQVRLVIENRGTRIPPEQAGRLFDRFFRLDPARAASGEGAGLGLAITRSIVEAHHGSIALEVADDLARFRLVFPEYGTAPDAGAGRGAT